MRVQGCRSDTTSADTSASTTNTVATMPSSAVASRPADSRPAPLSAPCTIPSAADSRTTSDGASRMLAAASTPRASRESTGAQDGGVSRRSRPRPLRRPRRRLRRGPLDGAGRGRHERAGPGADGGALRALRLARRHGLPEPPAFGAAPRVRRAPGTAALARAQARPGRTSRSPPLHWHTPIGDAIARSRTLVASHAAPARYRGSLRFSQTNPPAP